MLRPGVGGSSLERAAHKTQQLAILTLSLQHARYRRKSRPQTLAVAQLLSCQGKMMKYVSSTWTWTPTTTHMQSLFASASRTVAALGIWALILNEHC